jgi:hypothetical protein
MVLESELMFLFEWKEELQKGHRGATWCWLILPARRTRNGFLSDAFRKRFVDNIQAVVVVVDVIFFLQEGDGGIHTIIRRSKSFGSATSSSFALLGLL